MLDKSNEINDLQFQNIAAKLLQFEVSNSDKSNDLNNKQCVNKYCISVTLDVLNESNLKFPMMNNYKTCDPSIKLLRHQNKINLMLLKKCNFQTYYYYI